MMFWHCGRRPSSPLHLLPRRALIVRTLLLLLAASTAVGAAELTDLLPERLKAVVAVEYVTETEVERRPTVTTGTVIDENGTIMLQSGAIDPRTAISQLKEFRVYLAGEGNGSRADYLGQDAFTGWHFVRAGREAASRLVPVTRFMRKTSAEPGLAQRVWGIGLRNKDEDFLPYVLQSHVAMLSALPQRTAIAQQEVAAPGLPVFDADGVFVGIAVNSFGQSFLQFSRTGRAQPVTLVNVEESSAFITAAEVIPYLDRIPKSASGRPIAWLGAFGLEPMDREVAKFLNLDNQSGAVVSEVLEGSPAERAGLLARDIILAVDGKPIPPLKPNTVVPAYVEREVERRLPGDTMMLTVLRGSERIELRTILGEEPKLLREADRRYFDRIGVTVREFVYGDAIVRRVKAADQSGCVVHYAKPSSPAAVAGLREEDWIREIDGVDVKTFAAAIERLEAVEKDEMRSECVLLVSRGSETAVLRVKLR